MRRASLIFLLSLATPLQAQERPQPTQEQANLYRRAQEAYAADDYATAVVLLQTANGIQPFDLFHYNIARAHIRLNQCADAQQAYLAAREAPRLDADLTQKISSGLKELETACPATLQITCAAPQTQVSVDAAPPVPCEALSPLSLAPGHHIVVATLGEQRETTPLELVGMQQTSLAIAIEAPEPTPPVTAAPTRDTRTRHTLGLALSVSGGALLATSLVLDQTLVRSRRDAFAYASQSSLPYSEVVARRDALRRAQALTLTSAGLGLAAAAIGLPLFFSSSPEAPVAITFSHRF